MSLVDRLFAPPRPSVAIEIASTRVAALRVAAGTPAAATHAVEPLPAGAVVPSLTSPNIVDQPAVVAAITRVLQAVGGGRRVALVVPDAMAKVSLVRFDQVPARPAELEAMLRWQVRKSVPFRPDESHLTWVEGESLPAGGREFVVAMARLEVVTQYEQAVKAAGAHAGLINLASFELVNLVLAQGSAPDDWLLVHAEADYATLIVVRRGRVIFFRHRGVDAEETLADLVHQTAMYYEDRLSGRGFGRVLFAGAAEGPEGSAGAEQVRRALGERLGARVESFTLDGAATLSDRIAVSPTLADSLAPLAGILAGDPAA